MSLELQDVRVTVTDGSEDLTILDGASLRVEPGELVAVTGVSGSGKSTLAAVAGLLRRPSDGRVLIADEDLTDAPDRRRTAVRRDRIGLIFQSSNLFPSLTALEQLELVAHIEKQKDGDSEERARELLDIVGLGHRAGHRPAQLSGGERQRVAVARALVGDPSVILADEPTASLDETRGREIMALLADLAVERGAATLVISHAPDQLQGPDRILELRGGALAPAEPA